VSPINPFGEVMHNTPQHQQTVHRFASTVSQSLEGLDEQQRLTQENQINRQFMEMLDSYRATSGLARAQEVFTMYKVHHGNDVATLARWIVKRDVVTFDWQSKVWVPLFQFDRTNMSILPGMNLVLSVLNPFLGPWEMAIWFAQPNRCLQGRTPAEAMRSDPHGVLSAACMDRFIAV
jgi:hypothetical protein